MDIRNRISQLKEKTEALNKHLTQLQQQEQQTLRDIIATQGALQELQTLLDEDKKK